MKTVHFLIILGLLSSLFSCNKADTIGINPEVENYVELLKSGQYDSLNLPAFTPKDIPVLLKYRNETQIITNFPHNPISSYWGSECKLGIYILWTIESVRAVSINSRLLTLRFPSQNPILGYRDSFNWVIVYDDVSHEIAANAYFQWWENNKNRNFNSFKNIDPLSDTEYSWH